MRVNDHQSSKCAASALLECGADARVQRVGSRLDGTSRQFDVDPQAKAVWLAHQLDRAAAATLEPEGLVQMPMNGPPGKCDEGGHALELVSFRRAVALAAIVHRVPLVAEVAE